MDTDSTRDFTPARIVALGLITVLVGGLAWLRFAPEAGPVSVPLGATAGDLTLEPCDIETENGTRAADCGTLVVPEDRTDPESRLIALPVVRIHARSENPGAPIFRFEGGPGITNLGFEQASRYADDHDFVIVGYRGVDGSVRLDCPEVGSAIARTTELLTETAFRATAVAFRSCAERLADEGFDLSSYGLVDQVDDMEAARVALGYDRINLMSESAGTRTAMIYAWRYPESIYRSVMIGVNPPGRYLWDPKATDEVIDRYAEMCANDATCSERTDDLAASMRTTMGDVPGRWLFLPIKERNARLISFFGLMESTPEAGGLNGPATLDAWLSAAEGDPSGLWLMSTFADVFMKEAFVYGQYAAAGIIDADAARDYFQSGEEERKLNVGYAGTAHVWAEGRLADAWPAARDGDSYTRVQKSEVETLLIGGDLDATTPPQIATRDLLPSLANGRQVVLPGLGHTLSFYAEQPEAGTRLINNFYDTGRVDDSLYEPQSVDFSSSLTGFTKTVVGILVGLALVVIISLLWMARRVRKRGHFGPVASAALRSASPVVLGLGGWSLGALIILTTMPGVRPDNEFLSIVAIGAPAGLGIYWAWVNRDWSVDTRRGGLAAAGGGALVGAWLGFNAIDGLPALVTASVGAAVAANLALIGLDIYRARSECRHAPSAPAETTRELVGV